jgi:hypothetical protein
MRFSILTITSAAVAAVGTNAIEAAGKFKFLVSANQNSNEVAAHKHPDHAAPAIPHYAPGSFEPTYMPEEDLNPHHVHALCLSLQLPILPNLAVTTASRSG